MHDGSLAFGAALGLIAGLANLFYPHQVMSMCKAMDRLLPFPNLSPFQESIGFN